MAQFQTLLDPTLHSPEVKDFERSLTRRVVGQDRAIRRLARIYQVYKAGLAVAGRPLANLLFLGPTGSGKTRLVEAAGEVLFGSDHSILKIDCAEFQHSHEIAKLIGSPPGYLGHRETQPLITQEALEAHYTDTIKLSFVLFDEIEKASDALWHLLLGILDKATLTLGDNRRVDFSHSIIFLTSNLGSHEVSRLMRGGMGFSADSQMDDEDLDHKIYRVAVEAARRRFSPEFMNRIDKVIVFRSLRKEHLEKILDIELAKVQERIIAAAPGSQFVFKCTRSARDLLLREGTDLKSGARHLKRAIERHLVFPLSNLMATKQVCLGDVITVDAAPGLSKLVFMREEQGALVGASAASVTQTALVPVSTGHAVTQALAFKVSAD
ncbi:MAG: ATP-dependent Clp protease ATP-binding subunit [Acidobacteria bacterium]|nr:MAG: ATP-dependent Clp protease ATP-binding subunit [Acidobacteriota bacterium]